MDAPGWRATFGIARLENGQNFDRPEIKTHRVSHRQAKPHLEQRAHGRARAQGKEMTEQEELIQDIRERLGEMPTRALPFNLLAFTTTIEQRYSMTQNDIIRLVMQEADALGVNYRIGWARAESEGEIVPKDPFIREKFTRGGYGSRLRAEGEAEALGPPYIREEDIGKCPKLTMTSHSGGIGCTFRSSLFWFSFLCRQSSSRSSLYWASSLTSPGSPSLCSGRNVSFRFLLIPFSSALRYGPFSGCIVTLETHWLNTRLLRPPCG
jgi:hypothetical protein